MFDCAGLYDDMVVTVSYPCSEIVLWNKNTLEKIKEINLPLKLSGDTYIDENKLYICSRNISGIGLIYIWTIISTANINYLYVKLACFPDSTNQKASA